MKLQFKEAKVRDLFLYHTNIMPVSVRIKRQEIIFYIKASHLKEQTMTEDVIKSTMAYRFGRKVSLNILPD